MFFVVLIFYNVVGKTHNIADIAGQFTHIDMNFHKQDKESQGQTFEHYEMGVQNQILRMMAGLVCHPRP